jgi:Cof subfamily protein (haloacid dehalogenase superfamily)
MDTHKTHNLIRLVAIDIDQTLSTDGINISDRVLSAVQGAAAHGAYIVLSTGRMRQSAVHFARLFGLDAPLICYHGALVESPGNLKPLLSISLASATVQDVLQFLTTEPVELLVNIEDELYSTTAGAGARRYAQIAGVSLNIVTHLASIIYEKPVYKIIYITAPGQVSEIANRLRQTVLQGISIYEISPVLGEIIHSDVDKGNALRLLAKHMGIPASQVMVIGDNDSDAGMVHWAGIGVAMGNANDNLKALAKIVTGTVEEDGVAQVLEQYFTH